MGTHDISITRALNITFKNCSQTNDINDPDYWGIMGSNYCKNIVYDNAPSPGLMHMGVANATIRNSTLGHQGINAIGYGTFTLENSTIYGQTWSICVPITEVRGGRVFHPQLPFRAKRAEVG